MYVKIDILWNSGMQKIAFFRILQIQPTLNHIQTKICILQSLTKYLDSFFSKSVKRETVWSVFSMTVLFTLGFEVCVIYQFLTKVISLFPRKVIKYFCNPGFHFWGQEVIECDPDQGWLGSLGTCLVDSSLNKIAYSSSSGVDANVPIRQNKFEGNYHFQHY